MSSLVQMSGRIELGKLFGLHLGAYREDRTVKQHFLGAAFGGLQHKICAALASHFSCAVVKISRRRLNTDVGTLASTFLLVCDVGTGNSNVIVPT